MVAFDEGEKDGIRIVPAWKWLQSAGNHGGGVNGFRQGEVLSRTAFGECVVDSPNLCGE